MDRNVGKTDMFIRLAIGIPITIFSLLLDSYWLILGLTLIISSMKENCTMYSILDISTR